jgi:cell wall-associated NlpC family hydrolase
LSSREQLIRQLAVKYGMDPEAVVAIASVEGQRALHGGVSVGDHGTSFGPFQLHAGGALPKGKGSAWAHSPAGIEYAVSHMAPYAKGLHGQKAVAAISSRFERPADVPGEISKAMGFYGHGGGGGSTPAGALPAAPGGSGAGTDAVQGLQQQALKAMYTSALMQPGGIDSNTLLSMAVARKQYGAADQAAQQQPVIQGKPNSDTAARAAKDIHEYLGVKYQWGGESPKGFDCSGLMQYVWAKEGVKIPRTSYDQWRHGAPVGKQQLRPGDAVFFRGSDAKGNLPGHVGMYVGNGQFIEAAHTGTNVRYSDLADRKDFVGGRRFA